MNGGDVPRVDIRVIRIREPRTIADPRIKALIMRAVVATSYPGTTAQAFYDEIAAGIGGHTQGVFVGFDEDRAPVALCIATLPWSAVMCWPQVNLVYSKDRALSRMIGDRIRVWLKQHGYDQIVGCNLLHDDEAFCRVFGHMGETKVIGSLVEARI